MQYCSRKSQYPIDPVIAPGVTLLLGICGDQLSKHYTACSLFTRMSSKVAMSQSLGRADFLERRFSLALNAEDDTLQTNLEHKAETIMDLPCRTVGFLIKFQSIGKACEAFWIIK